MEKCGRTRQAVVDNVIRRIRFACWKTKATDTHSEHVIFYYFYAATMVTRTRLSLTSINSLSCNLQLEYSRGFPLRIIPQGVQHLWFVYLCSQKCAYFLNFFFQDVFLNVSLNGQQSVTVTKSSYISNKYTG